MSIRLRVTATGAGPELIERRLSDMKGGMLKVGGVFSTHLDQSLRQGRRYMGDRMEPVAKWTRWATGKSESKPPLNVTGRFRRGHRILSVSSKRVVFGPKHSIRKQASLMFYGGPSKIPVERNKIRTGRDGSQYIRINVNGNWFTKKVKNGHIDVEVQAREYIGLTQKQADQAVDVLMEFLFN